VTWAPQEAPGQVAAVDDQLADRGLEVLVLDHEAVALLGGDQEGHSEQLADERTARTVGPPDQVVELTSVCSTGPSTSGPRPRITVDTVLGEREVLRDDRQRRWVRLEMGLQARGEEQLFGRASVLA